MKNLFFNSLVILGAVFAMMSTGTCEETVPLLMRDLKVVDMPVNPTPAEKEQIQALQQQYESNPASATPNTNLRAQQDHKQLTMTVCNKAKDKNVTGAEHKALMNLCLELKKNDELLAHYPAAKTIWVKVKYVSDPPGAVLYIATPENRLAQTLLAQRADFDTASIAYATKSLSDPRWRSQKEKEEGPGFVIKLSQKDLADTNLKLKEFEKSAAATGVRMGYAPFTVRYPLDVDMGVKSDEKQVFILPAMLRWASGATAPVNIRIDLNRIELLKAAGTKKTITVKRPDNVPGRVADEEFALKVEALRQQELAQETPACKNEEAAVEKERQAILLAKGHVSEAEGNKFQTDLMAYAFRCLPPSQAALIEQRLHDINVETQMKIDAINARQQPTIMMLPSRPSMEELIMQPPVSNSFHCTTDNVNGTVYTDCH